MTFWNYHTYESSSISTDSKKKKVRKEKPKTSIYG